MEYLKIKNFKDLMIWQSSVDLTKEIYLLTKNFPSDELYGLVSQIRRASVSVASNIAEGYMRRNKNEFKRFLHIALGSFAELETQLIITGRLDYIDKNNQQPFDKIHEINRMIMGLINKVKQK